MLHYKSNNIIIATVGDRSIHRFWGRAGHDLCLINYGHEQNYSHECDYYFEAKGTKYHLIQDIIDQLPKYDYYWLPDDDIFLDPIGVNRLFRIMRQYNLLIGQPSIIGWYGVCVALHQQGSILRYTNWAEIMCPCFSRNALVTCKPYFKENQSGWGYELLWNKLLNNPQRGIGIIDDVVAIHTRPTFGGELYKTIGSNSEQSVKSEAIALIDKYNLAENTMQNAAHGELIESEVYGFVQYAQVLRPMEAGVKRNERFWPSCCFLKMMTGAFSTECDIKV